MFLTTIFCGMCFIAGFYAGSNVSKSRERKVKEFHDWLDKEYDERI